MCTPTDANGNRASRNVNGTLETYAVDDADRLLSVSVGGSPVKSYAYDGAGRTTSVTSPSGTTSLSYDYEGRISSIRYPSGATNSFSYNGANARVAKSDSSGSYSYRRDGVEVTDPVLSDGSASYTPGVSERRGGASRFYGTDRLGSTKSETDSSQSVVATKSYDAFGNLVSSSGTSASPFGFAGAWGYQTDSDSGLMLLGNRYYDPSTGRFLTPDPIKDGRNWYTYVDNNPLVGVDPRGLSFWKWGDERWVEFSAWFGGRDVTDPNGNPVRIGGWPALFNPDENAMTVDGTIHINDEDDYRKYIGNPQWSEHERVHIDQENNYHGGNAVAFVGAVVWQYILAGGHDGAPYEGEAEAGSTSRKVFPPTGVYGVLAR